MAVKQISASLENYLETILEISDENQNVRAIDISKQLNVSKASVTEAIKTLAEKGFVNYSPYQNITLTNQGETLAKEVALKHNVLTDFLVEVLGIDKKEAKENACRIEHVISKQVLDRLMHFLEFNKVFCYEKHNFLDEFKNYCKKIEANSN